ncbi:PAS domain S-box protein [Tautonia plasticadhaerens]|uniref:histidine kinase n=1 Tax=Tautonia plasticadhaerens TaxID=2527974 RepID=A0A518HDX3_9BACT|nr:PAS domain S-box protein [Tautonia plasticadhaerens]QDV39054.1 Non-motile and phage-resistance protein [Tautonia plasticadhaerens]
MVRPAAIRLRLLLPSLVAAFALLMLTGFRWLELRAVRLETLAAVSQEVLASGVQLRQDVSRLLRRGETEGVAEVLAWSGVHPLSAGSALIGPAGRVRAATRAGWVGRPAAEALPSAWLPGGGDDRDRARVRVPDGSSLVVGSFPVRPDAGGSDRLLVPALDAGRPIALERAAEWREFRLMALVALAGAGLLALALNRLVSRRVDALARAVDRIAAGELDARPGVGGGDEIGRLARGLGAMAGRLADAARTRDRAERLMALQNALLTRTGEATLGPLADLHPGDLSPIAFDHLSRDLNCDLFFHYEVRDGALRLVSGSGVDEEAMRRFSRLEFGQELCGEVARLGRPIYLQDLQRSDDPLAATDRGLGVRCYACHPLFSGEELIGTFAVASRARDRLDEADLDLIRGASRAIAAAMARLRDAAALRQGEARYRAVVETCPDGILVIEPSGRLVEVNRAYARRSGYGRGELLALSVADLEAAESPERVLEHLAAILREGSDRFETVHRTRAGEPWPVEVTISADPGSGRLVAFTRDVSNRKRAEAALRKSEERHRLALDGAGLGTWDWHVPSGAIALDDRWAGMLGYAREELEPHLSAWERLVHPDDEPAAVVAIRESLDGPDPTYSAEYRLRHKDGGWVWILDAGRVIERDAQGRAVRMCGVHQDITARKQTEQALRASEERFRILADHATDAIMLHRGEPEATILDANQGASEALGYSRGELIGMSPTDFDPAITPEGLSALGERLRDGESAIFDTVHRRRDGSTFPVEVRCRPFAVDGQPFTLSISRDITERKQAEEALRVSEERHRLALDGAGLGTWDWHVPSGRAVFCERWAGMLGYAREELEPHVSAWERLIHPDDEPAVTSALGPHLGGSSAPYSIEFRLRHRDGRWVWVQATGRVIERDAQGRAVRMCGVHQDVTARKRAEEALRESEARLRVALEAAGAVAFVWDAVADRATRYYSTEPALPENVGRPAPLAEVRARVLPEDRGAFDAGIAACLDGGSEYRNLYRVSRPDGSVGWLEEWGHPERDANGRLLRLTGFAIDVTERKRIEAEILALNADLERRVAERTEDVRKLAAIIDSSTDFIAIDAPDGSHLWENRAYRQATGVGPEGRRVSVSIGEMHPPRSARRILDEALPAADRHGHWVGETELYSADGRAIPVSQLILSHRGPDGRVEYRSTIMRDITERTLLERILAERSDQLAIANAQLARASRLKDEFLASMSHELRTPLNGVLGLSEAMQEGIYGPVSPEQVDALGDVLRSGRHLLSLINDILDLSRIEAGRMELDPAPSPVGDLCEAGLRMVRELALRKRQVLSMAIRGVDAPAMLDERRVKQILVNLLGNAVKFTPEGGEIGLEVEGDRARGELRFTVRDTGIGIAQHDLEAIFQPFRQLDSRLARSYSGTGLGLALVRRMAEMHGGDVSARSEPGQGSRFTVRLPWILPDEGDPDGPPDAPPLGPGDAPPDGRAPHPTVEGLGTAGDGE